jgi:hypothetical protein
MRLLCFVSGVEISLGSGYIGTCRCIGLYLLLADLRDGCYTKLSRYALNRK